MSKTISIRVVGLLLGAMTVVAATCLAPASANAQSDFQGKFTLPFETHWGQAVLPAGDYTLTFRHDKMATLLVIWDAHSLRYVAFESTNDREDNAEVKSELLIGTRGTQHVVYSLRIAELGETFVYQRPSARESEEALKTQAVPVLVAKK